jgi:isopenicillin-N N-acyltransferase-like protein
MSELPIVELSGTPYEMGLAHGRAMREAVVEFAASVSAVHQANNSFLKAEKDSLVDFCLRNLGFLQKFSPGLVEEMRGIAEGAGISFEDVLYLNSFLELEDVRAASLGGRLLPDTLWGCTTFNISPAASSDGAYYIGQTYDMERYYEKYLCLLRIRTETGPDQLVLTFAGVLGLCGLNSAGVGAVINKITATDARPGVIYPFIMRTALASERIGDALGAVVHSPRATGMNYQLAGEGAAFCVETSARCYEAFDVSGASPAMAHTNHYISQSMRRFETPGWLSHGGTMVRRQVAQRFLDEHHGRLNPETLKKLTRDHTNHPRCICAHGFEGEGEETAFHTVFGVIMDPGRGWLEICPGNPCENEYQRCGL